MQLQLYYIAYASRITLMPALQQATFLDIERESQLNNPQSGITGLLLFKSGKFFQYFEGDELSCQNLLIKIKSDSRHSHFTVLSEGKIQKRQCQS